MLRSHTQFVNHLCVILLICLFLSACRPSVAYTANVAVSNDSGLVCYDRQERWVNSGGQKNVPPECRINGSQVFCMRFKVTAEPM